MLANFPSFSLVEWGPRFLSHPAGFQMESLVTRCVHYMFLVFSLCLNFGGNGWGVGQQDKKGSSTCRVLSKETFKLSGVVK